MHFNFHRNAAFIEDPKRSVSVEDMENFSSCHGDFVVSRFARHVFNFEIIHQNRSIPAPKEKAKIAKAISFGGRRRNRSIKILVNVITKLEFQKFLVVYGGVYDIANGEPNAQRTNIGGRKIRVFSHNFTTASFAL